jgi:hypothetical protein
MRAPKAFQSTLASNEPTTGVGDAAAYLKEQVGNACRLVTYAAEAGIPIDERTRTTVLRSPLAIAFMVGYAVDVFFSFLETLIQTFRRK